MSLRMPVTKWRGHIVATRRTHRETVKVELNVGDVDVRVVNKRRKRRNRDEAFGGRKGGCFCGSTLSTQSI